VFVHRIDPILASVAGVHLWWYGLSYALGFLNIYVYLRRIRERLEKQLFAANRLSTLSQDRSVALEL
jgi:prolipoprotein diacylglyceryltransferase